MMRARTGRKAILPPRYTQRNYWYTKYLYCCICFKNYPTNSTPFVSAPANQVTRIPPRKSPLCSDSIDGSTAMLQHAKPSACDRSHVALCQGVIWFFARLFGDLFHPHSKEGQRMGKQHLKQILKAVGRGCVREARGTDAKVMTMYSQQMSCQTKSDTRRSAGMVWVGS